MKRGLKARPLIKDEEYSETYEHYSDDVEIGGNQSNSGTLGLTQPERKNRFSSPVLPHSAIAHAKELRQGNQG